LSTSKLPPHSVIDNLRMLSVDKAIPLQASLELTNRCNERCTHCYIDHFRDDPQRILSKEDWFLIIQKLRDAGTLYLVLMGGEAMLNPFFWDILAYANDLHLHVSMITNGLKIQTQNVAKRLKETGLHVVTVSLYSLDELIHDEMTAVMGSHVKTMHAIELLLEQGIEVTINCLLTRQNIETHFDLIEWCIGKNLQIKEDVTVTPKLSGDLSPVNLRATQQQLRWYFGEKARRWPKSTPRPIMESPEDYVCNVAKGKCAVTAYGELLGCIDVRESFGSLLTEDFSTIWNSPIALKWRNLKLKDIKGINILSGCGHFCEHCFGMAIHESDTPLTLTEGSKVLASVKEAVYQSSFNEQGDARDS